MSVDQMPPRSPGGRKGGILRAWESQIGEAQRLALLAIEHEYPETLAQSPKDPLVMLTQVAPIIGRPVNTLYQWRNRSRTEYSGPGKMTRIPFPKPKAGRLYLLSDLVRWLVETNKWDSEDTTAWLQELGVKVDA